jgi:uncharacterized protein (DUF952 family)/2'-5' RNA ligase
MSNQYVVVGFLDEPPTEEFKSSEWPLHMTLLPPFTYNGLLDELCDELNTIAMTTRQFSVKTNGVAMFGPNKDIPVSLVKQNESLSVLHSKLTSLVTKLSLKYKHPFLSKNGYRFHITTQRGKKAPTDKNIEVVGFSLVDRKANDTPGLKKVVKSFNFMKKIYHIANLHDWEKAQASGFYETSTLGKKFEDVGFIHLSFEDQFQLVGKHLYKDMDNLVLLEINPKNLESEIKIEAVEGSDLEFPHLYDKLPATNVIKVTKIRF